MQLAKQHYLELLASTEPWPGTRPAPGCLSVLVNDSGTSPPLFWCGQHGEELAALGQRFAGERPVYGLKSTAYVVPTNNQHVGALAAHYASEMTRLQPGGAYHLGGFCAGGMLAFEIARCLQAERKQVGLLALVEVGFDDIACRLNRLVARGLRHRQDANQMGAGARLEFWGARAMGLLAGRGRRRFAEVRSDVSYRFESYPGSAHFFYAERGINSRFRYRVFQRRLASICRGGAHVHLLPGMHDVFESPAALDALSGHLREHMAPSTLA